MIVSTLWQCLLDETGKYAPHGVDGSLSVVSEPPLMEVCTLLYGGNTFYSSRVISLLPTWFWEQYFTCSSHLMIVGFFFCFSFITFEKSQISDQGA